MNESDLIKLNKESENWRRLILTVVSASNFVEFKDLPKNE